MLLARSHRLPDGLRVRLRYPHPDDGRRVTDLYGRLGLALDEMTARRLVRVDVRRRHVVCALAWIDGGEVLVGFAAGPTGGGEPELLVADEVAAAGVGELLRDALAEQARLHVA